MTDAGPEISLFDEAGQKRLELSQTSSALGLRLFDSNSLPVVSLRLPQNVEPAHLEIRSPQGSTLTKADGFSVRDAADHGRLQLALVNGNYPLLGISQAGQNGPPSIELTAVRSLEALKLHDAQGFPLATLFADDDGRTALDTAIQIANGRCKSPQVPRNLRGLPSPSSPPRRPMDRAACCRTCGSAWTTIAKPYVRIVGDDGRPLFAAPTP